MTIEKQDNIKVLEEIAKICKYLCDQHIKEIITYNKDVADCFEMLDYSVEAKNGEWTIRRKKFEIRDTGYEF